MSEDTMKLSKTTARAESYAAAHTAVDCSARLIRHAEQSDLEGIERLLTENKLPTAGVRESLDHFVIAEDRSAVIGAIGLEVFGDSALLRSAVVDQHARSTGLGTELVQRVIAKAAQIGVRELYLLTTTAQDYFPRFGFVHTARETAPEGIRGSVEFRGACPASATLMVRIATPKEGEIEQSQGSTR